MVFSGHLLTDYSQPFEVILAAPTVYECVRHCFELGCVKAAFTRFPRSACLLHFASDEKRLTESCENTADESLKTNWEFSAVQEVVQLDCIRCGTL